ncbi:hypothetical protein, partial [Candidatus Arsenophonus nilaparvatae]|uniref:hypothetical protein n=1 Tax=Candidatus Arsenophonus nilaparvatae TaxID=1247023 RepID=UPI0005096001
LEDPTRKQPRNTPSVFAQCIEVGGQIKVDGRDIIVKNNMPVGTLLGTFTTDVIKTYQCANVKNIITGARVHGEFATYGHLEKLEIFNGSPACL